MSNESSLINSENFLIKSKSFVADYSFITGEYSNIDSLIDSNCMVHYNYKTLVRGYKHYELSNHLGNVLAVFSDKRITLCSSSVVSGYEADVVSASDYYPFGMLMSYRSFSSPVYRYGFNGQEKDDEVSGSGNTNTAEYWEYDTRLGRRWNIDPVIKVWESSYACFSNSPVLVGDIKGNDGIVTIVEAPAVQKGKKKIEGGDKKNPNTMTIKANYYFNRKDLSKVPGAESALQEAANTYNNSSNVVKGADGKYYKVKFEITIIPVDEEDHREIQLNHSAKDYKGDGTNAYFTYGNTIGVDMKNEKKDPNELGWASYNNISLNSEIIQKYKGGDLETSLYNTFLHEIGHNLGGAHSDAGAMAFNITSETAPQIKTSTNQETIKFVLKNKLTTPNVQQIVNTVRGDGRTEARPGQVKIPL